MARRSRHRSIAGSGTGKKYEDSCDKVTAADGRVYLLRTIRNGPKGSEYILMWPKSKKEIMRAYRKDKIDEFLGGTLIVDSPPPEPPEQDFEPWEKNDGKVPVRVGGMALPVEVPIVGKKWWSCYESVAVGTCFYEFSKKQALIVLDQFKDHEGRHHLVVHYAGEPTEYLLTDVRDDLLMIAPIEFERIENTIALLKTDDHDEDDIPF